jgi:hypothetical protein
MYRDFAADRSVGADEHSSTYRESAGTVLKSFHVASATAEQEAELIMRRLVRNYLERSPIGSCPIQHEVTLSNIALQVSEVS